MEDEPITQNQMAALLGRSLSALEVKNYDLYLELAIARLSDLLCLQITEMDPIPADLLLVLARCFGVIQEEQEASVNHGVNRKQVEDFSISYFEDASSPMVDFAKVNEKTLDKYSQCQAPIKSGKVFCGNCIYDL